MSQILPFESELYNAEQSQKIDQFIIGQLGVGSLDLMSKAAFACFAEIQKGNYKKVAVVCGVGNNAGDGLMIAALCHMAGLSVEVFLCSAPESLSQDSQYMLKHAQSVGVVVTKLDVVNESFIISISQADVVVDAILGTGVNRNVEGLFASVINTMNNHSKNTLSVDVPSGICATTGKVFKVAIVANKTVSFICKKLGLYTAAAPDYVGEMVFAPLVDWGNFKFELAEKSQAKLLDKKGLPDYLNLLPRAKTINKSDKGHVAMIAGDKGMFGAAVMSAYAALKVGAGRVSLFTHPQNNCDALSAAYPEIMCHKLHSAEAFLKQADQFDVIAAGCGMSINQPWSKNILPSILLVDKPMVIDAGALDFLKSLKQCDFTFQRLITPHEGEASRLLGIEVEYIREHRVQITKELAEKYNLSVLLKGCGSLLYSNNTMYLNPYGANILATAGSGDIFTGVIAGLAAQIKCMQSSALFALLLQGVAAENHVAKHGMHGFVASMLLDEIVEVMNGGYSY
ncbi:NAD(P)H-hydrate dehydratase [Cysteiniphilum sp. 6C5]|uniref:NAD(P)H-hydrate dehydratase n=1 Tax=unclassified Cysteiniphilum TaxID=2610889 RepID=UPI003F8428A4